MTTEDFIKRLNMTTEDFIKRARLIHGDKYDYSESIYENTKAKLIINCKNCSQSFLQEPRIHLRGANCPRCAKALSNQKLRHTSEKFIEQARQVHGDKFDYSEVYYTGSNNKITVKCQQCQHCFAVTAHHHLSGSNCPNCFKISLSESKLLTGDDFIAKAVAIHGDKYDYSMVVYKGVANKIKINCNNCRLSFEQLANNHITGSGCPECVRKEANLAKTKPSDIVEAELHAQYGDRFDYTQLNYSNCTNKIKVICKQCNKHHFTFIHNHRRNGACPYCQVSMGQRQVIDFITKLGVDEIIINDRKAIAPFELDIYLPQKQLAIEFNGLYHHSFDSHTSSQLKNRHQTKALLTIEKSIKLVQFWSIEWEQKLELVQSMVRHYLGLSQSIYARKCQITSASADFFNSNHVQGNRNASVGFGLSYNNQIVAGMTFSRHPAYEWEVIRYANLINHSVVGGASKLFSHFCKLYKPSTVFSYANLRFSNGKLYENLGFKKLGITKPNYSYTNGRNFITSRQHYQKKQLSKILPDFDPQLSETENCFKAGLRQLWDAGHIKYLWTRVE